MEYLPPTVFCRFSLAVFCGGVPEDCGCGGVDGVNQNGGGQEDLVVQTCGPNYPSVLKGRLFWKLFPHNHLP